MGLMEFQAQFQREYTRALEGVTRWRFSAVLLALQRHA
jgi:hypothetical protein